MAVATAVTYHTGTSARALRTVLLSDVRESVVLLPVGSLDVLIGKMLHGATCAHALWDEALGTQGDDFVIPAAQVVARRPMAGAVKTRYQGVISDDGSMQLKAACRG